MRGPLTTEKSAYLQEEKTRGRHRSRKIEHVAKLAALVDPLRASGSILVPAQATEVGFLPGYAVAAAAFADLLFLGSACPSASAASF